MDFEKQHRRNLEKYKAEVNRIFDEALGKIAQVGINVNADEDFLWSDHPEAQDRLLDAMNMLGAQLLGNVRSGIEIEWELANQKNDAIADKATGGIQNLDLETQQIYYGRNEDALKSFIERDEAGMNLSHRVWRLCDQFRTETELGIAAVMADGLHNGRSAEELQRKVKQYLNEPNRIFRRRRNPITGKLELSKAAKAYHPGTGVYRSSRKNALRMTATETNIAFRTSDHERVKKFDFVLGVKVVCSNNHPVKDICDDLAGEYPKDFKFTGWHPWCRCHTETILKKDTDLREERRKRREALLNGQPIPASDQSGEITEMPSNYSAWIKNNRDRIEAAQASGKLPYFLRDNLWSINSTKVPADLLYTRSRAMSIEEVKIDKYEKIREKVNAKHQARTQAEIDSIKQRWSERLAAIEKAKKREEILAKAKERHEARTENEIENIKDHWKARKSYLPYLDDYKKLIKFETSNERFNELLEEFTYMKENQVIGYDVKGTIKELNSIMEKESQKTKPVSSIIRKENETAEELVKRLGDKTPKTLENLQDSINKFNYLDKDFEDHKEFIEKKMLKLFDDNDFGMDIKHGLLESVFEKGFLNTFQTGTSEGYIGSSLTTGEIEHDHSRLVMSQKMFNRKTLNKISDYTYHGKQLKRNEYEKYGHLLDRDKYRSITKNSTDYGDVQVRFKKEKVLTTWTFDDSLRTCGPYFQPSLTTDPKIHSFDDYCLVSEIINPLNKWDDLSELQHQLGTAYIELQYHGDVTIDMVESMTFTENPEKQISRNLIEKLMSKGIELWYKHDNKIVRYKI